MQVYLDHGGNVKEELEYRKFSEDMPGKSFTFLEWYNSLA
jgi:hypothetical protein